MELEAVTKRKTELFKIYNDYIGLLVPEEKNRAEERLHPIMEKMDAGEFQIVVMGEIKKGKSSFIASLLGEYDVLPTDSDVATSTVYKIKYGDECKYTVMFIAEEREPEVISKEQISKYGTENGNHDNEKQVAFIQIELPHPLLKQGLVIVDTPGVGGLYKEHRRITFEYAPYADAVFFVVDSVECVLTEQEIQFLKDLYKITAHVFFIQTKTDAVDTESWQAWKERNIDILTQSEELAEYNLVKEKIQYFPLSSKLKKFADEDPESAEALEDLEESGFIKLSDFIENELVGEQKLILVQRALNTLREDIQHTQKIERENFENIKSRNEDELAEKEGSINEILDKITKWESDDWTKAKNDFIYELSQQTAISCQEIRAELGPDQEKFKGKVDEIRQQYDSLSTLIDQAEEILNNYISFCALSGKEVTMQFLGTIEKAFYKITNKALDELVTISKYNNFSLGGTSLDLDNTFSYKGLAADAAAGGIVGGALAGGMWWALIGPAVAVGVVGPGGIPVFLGGMMMATPLGWAAIGAVGLLGAVGAGLGVNKLREKKKINEVINLLRLEMEKISNQAIENFDEHIDTLTERIKEQSSIIFGKVGESSRHDAEALLEELRKAKEYTEQEADAEMKKRQEVLDNLDNLHQKLQHLHAQEA